jgi:alkanesulfonate monooxygenase SsuD/methylene tetrahydromethanopterin reductase-like flavin-dependent oxidoreductase (luciferase family)
VKFGISYNTAYYGTDPGAIAGIARHAEACGFESFYVPEHIALYPGANAGGIQFPPSLAVADPLECLSFVAAATSRILLGTAVLRRGGAAPTRRSTCCACCGPATMRA